MGSAPAYLIIAEMERRKRMQQGAGAGEMPQSTVADDVMASMPDQGVAALPVDTGALEYADGGLVSFAKGGSTKYRGLVDTMKDMGVQDTSKEARGAIFEQVFGGKYEGNAKQNEQLRQYIMGNVAPPQAAPQASEWRMPEGRGMPGMMQSGVDPSSVQAPPYQRDPRTDAIESVIPEANVFFGAKAMPLASLIRPNPMRATTIMNRDAKNAFMLSQEAKAMGRDRRTYAEGGLVSFQTGGTVPADVRRQFDAELKRRQALMAKGPAAAGELQQLDAMLNSVAGQYRELAPLVLQARQGGTPITMGATPPAQASPLLGTVKPPIGKAVLDAEQKRARDAMSHPVPPNTNFNLPTNRHLQIPAGHGGDAPAPTGIETLAPPPATKPGPTGAGGRIRSASSRSTQATAPAAQPAAPAQVAPTPADEPPLPQQTHAEAFIKRMQDQEAAAKGGQLNNALIHAGLAMMAGQSPNALTNIAAGGIAGLEAYQSSSKEQQALAEKIGTLQMGMEKDAHAGDMEAFKIKEGRLEKALGRANTLENTRLQNENRLAIAQMESEIRRADIAARNSDGATQKHMFGIKTAFDSAKAQIDALNERLGSMSTKDEDKPAIREQISKLVQHQQALAQQASQLLGTGNLPEMSTDPDTTEFKNFGSRPAGK
jgi:hypothetical protein